MDLEALASLSWREALIALIALLALYVAVVVVRMQRMKQAAQPPGQANPFAPAGAVAYATLEPQGGVAMQETLPEEAQQAPSGLPDEPAFAWNEPPEPFDGQTRLAVLERDLMQLRREVATLRAELRVVDEGARASLGELCEEMRRELSQARVVQNTSPIYSDAMQMATEGHDAATISEHCGIARAEAELVVALVRNRDTL